MFGNQISYTSNGIGYVYYTYRPDGLRHSIGDKVHVWDGANIVADVDGNDISVYIRGANLICVDDGNIIYYHFNAHGDVVALTNENGAKTKSYAYSAFGVEYSPSDFDDNPFRYCGEYFDKETNTIYLRARYYNAEQGRFTQEDPIRDGDNWYSYCGGNPIMFVDPSGKDAVAIFWNWLSGGWGIAIGEPTFLGEVVYWSGAVVLGVVAAVGSVFVANETANAIDKYITYKGSTALSDAIALMASAASATATPPPPNQGGKGTKTESKTLYTQNGKDGFHIDVENPGNRMGQIHLQKNGTKYYYNIPEQVFRIGSSTGELAPKSIQQLLQDPNVIKAIAKGLKILGY